MWGNRRTARRPSGQPADGVHLQRAGPGMPGRSAGAQDAPGWIGWSAPGQRDNAGVSALGLAMLSCLPASTSRMFWNAVRKYSS